MPTITGATIQAAAFQATSGTSTFQAITATTGRFSDSASGQPVIVNNGNASGAIRLIVTGQRGGSDKWHLGVDASDNGTILTANGATANLTWTDAGVFTFRAGITGATVTTAAPTGGAGTWKLGIANAVTPTSPNRTITVDIGGTLYYIHAKTTNN